MCVLVLEFVFFVSYFDCSFKALNFNLKLLLSRKWIVRMVNVDAFDGYGAKNSVTENATQNTFADSWMCWTNCGIICTETSETFIPFKIMCVRECCVKAPPCMTTFGLWQMIVRPKNQMENSHIEQAKIARALHTHYPLCWTVCVCVSVSAPSKFCSKTQRILPRILSTLDDCICVACLANIIYQVYSVF